MHLQFCARVKSRRPDVPRESAARDRLYTYHSSICVVSLCTPIADHAHTSNTLDAPRIFEVCCSTITAKHAYWPTKLHSCTPAIHHFIIIIALHIYSLVPHTSSLRTHHWKPDIQKVTSDNPPTPSRSRQTCPPRLLPLNTPLPSHLHSYTFQTPSIPAINHDLTLFRASVNTLIISYTWLACLFTATVQRCRA